MRGKLSRHSRTLSVTLIAVVLMGVLSVGDNAPLPTLFSALTRDLFALAAQAVPSDEEALAAENEQLRADNDSLRRQLAEDAELKSENETLWGYFNLKKENPNLTLLPAFVIHSDTDGFTLGVGANEGAAVNQAVVTAQGLVGRVVHTDGAACRVTTILSPSLKVGVRDVQTGDKGILSGTAALAADGLTAMDKLSEDNKIAVGDLIVTSGEGGVYPEQLIVGTVRAVRTNEYDATRYAVVEPAADLTHLDEAAVVTAFSAKGVKRGE